MELSVRQGPIYNHDIKAIWTTFWYLHHRKIVFFHIGGWGQECLCSYFTKNFWPGRCTLCVPSGITFSSLRTICNVLGVAKLIPPLMWSDLPAICPSPWIIIIMLFTKKSLKSCPTTVCGQSQVRHSTDKSPSALMKVVHFFKLPYYNDKDISVQIYEINNTDYLCV